MLPVSMSALTGYFLFNPEPVLRNISFTLGVLFLGMSASAINQLIEKDTDLKMNRTRRRPLPSGKLDNHRAILFVVATLITGSWFVFYYGNPAPLLMGLFNVLWYNAVYTPLKQKTAFAVVPGALTGAIPPLMGWTAAGGHPLDYPGLLMAFVFFMGQVPHFWLILLKYGEEYKSAGFKTVLELFSLRQINRLTFIWITVSVLSSLFLAFFDVIQAPAAKISLLLLVIAILSYCALMFRNVNAAISYRKAFILLNVFYLFLMLTIIGDGLIRM
jgi:protoheme IX farnesyltransferase